jgi:hypothetical protein
LEPEAVKTAGAYETAESGLAFKAAGIAMEAWLKTPMGPVLVKVSLSLMRLYL